MSSIVKFREFIHRIKFTPWYSNMAMRTPCKCFFLMNFPLPCSGGNLDKANRGSSWYRSLISFRFYQANWKSGWLVALQGFCQTCPLQSVPWLWRNSSDAKPNPADHDAVIKNPVEEGPHKQCHGSWSAHLSWNRSTSAMQRAWTTDQVPCLNRLSQEMGSSNEGCQLLLKNSIDMYWLYW